MLPEASSSTCLPLTNTAGSPSVHGHDLSPYTTLPSVYNNPYAALSAPEEYPFPILAPLPGTSSPTQNDTYAGLIPVTSPHLPPSSFPGPSHLTPFTSTFSTTEASAAPSTPPQRIPRPPNAFMLFRSDFLRQGIIPPHIEKRQQNLSAIAGECWRMMPKGEKEEWKGRAAEEQTKHQLKYPGYKFCPAPRGMGRGRANAPSAGEATGSGGKALQGESRLRGIREKYTGYTGSAPPPDRRRNKVGGVKRNRQEQEDAAYVSRQQQHLAQAQAAAPPPMHSLPPPQQVPLYPSPHPRQQAQLVAPSPGAPQLPHSQSQSNSPSHSQRGSPQYPNPPPQFNFIPPPGMTHGMSFTRPPPSIAGNVSNPYPRQPRRPSTSQGFIRTVNEFNNDIPRHLQQPPWLHPVPRPPAPQEQFATANPSSGVDNGNFPIATVPRRPSSTGQTLGYLQAHAMAMNMGMSMPTPPGMHMGGAVPFDGFSADFMSFFGPGRMDAHQNVGTYPPPPPFVHHADGTTTPGARALFGDYTFAGAGGSSGNGGAGAGSAVGSPSGSTGPGVIDSWAAPISPLEQTHTSASHDQPQPHQVQPQLIPGTTTPPHPQSPQQYVPLSMPQPQPHQTMPGAYPNMGMGILGLDMDLDLDEMDLGQWGGAISMPGNAGATHRNHEEREFRMPLIDGAGTVPTIPVYVPSPDEGVRREQEER